MKHLLLILVLLGTIHASPGAIPPGVANLFTVLELKLKQPVPGVRVQVMRIATDVFVDPSPGPDSFEAHASFVLTMIPSQFQQQLLNATESARGAKWEALEHGGYARWRFRVVGPWNEVIGDLGLDEENLAIVVRGKWYRVDESCVRALTTNLVKAAIDESSRSKQR